MAEAGDGSGHTPLTPEWTPAPRASHYPWQGDRPTAAPSQTTEFCLLQILVCLMLRWLPDAISKRKLELKLLVGFSAHAKHIRFPPPHIVTDALTLKQESLANAKESARQWCVYEGP